MSYTLGQAAKATGKTKAAIAQAIKKGRVSGIKDELGQWRIDPAELHRVYPLTQGEIQPKVGDSAPPSRVVDTKQAAELERMKATIEGLERLNRQIEGERDRLNAALEAERARRDAGDEERRKMQAQITALLTDQRAQPKPVATAKLVTSKPASAKRRWWIFGGRG